jgi:hypothetical protein
MFDRCLNFAIHATVPHVLSPQVRVAAIPPRRPLPRTINEVRNGDIGDEAHRVPVEEANI